MPYYTSLKKERYACIKQNASEMWSINTCICHST